MLAILPSSTASFFLYELNLELLISRAQDLWHWWIEVFVEVLRVLSLCHNYIRNRRLLKRNVTFMDHIPDPRLLHGKADCKMPERTVTPLQQQQRFESAESPIISSSVWVTSVVEYADLHI